jgi:hypothetical protein
MERDACFSLRHCQGQEAGKLQCKVIGTKWTSTTEHALLKQYKGQCCKSTIDRVYENSLIYGGLHSRHKFVYDTYARHKYCNWASREQLESLCDTHLYQVRPFKVHIQAGRVQVPSRHVQRETAPPTARPTPRAKCESENSRGCDKWPGGACFITHDNEWGYSCGCEIEWECESGCAVEFDPHRCVKTLSPTQRPFSAT